MPEAANNNFTKDSPSVWEMSVVPNMPTLPLIAIVEGNNLGDNKTFPFTITSIVPCDVPVALGCNASFHDLTPSQWEAFRVSLYSTNSYE